MKRRLLQILIIAGIMFSTTISCNAIHPAPNHIDKINLTDLLITSQDVPAGWLTSGPTSPAFFGDYMDDGTDSFQVTFNSDLGLDDKLISEEIYRSSGFNPIGRANDNYDYIVRGYFIGSTPLDWKFRSQFSDKSDYSCYTYSNSSDPVCDWIAQYDRIVIHVIAWLTPGRMTQAELETIVRKIDANASKMILNK